MQFPSEGQEASDKIGGKDMSFVAGKQANINGVWQRVSLSKEEVSKALDELLKLNMFELSRVIEAVNASILTEGVIDKNEMIKMLFERQGVASYTYLGNMLDEKIHELKSQGWKQTTAPSPKPPPAPTPQRKKQPIFIEDDEPDMVAGGDILPEEQQPNPFDTPKLKGEVETDEYEEIKIPEEKKKRGLF